jgi:hypothetical protein
VLRVAGDLVDQFQLAVRLELAGVGPDRLDLDTRHGLGGGDQDVRRAAGWELDGQVVDGVALPAFHDVDAEDVCARVAERGGHGPETARLVRKHDPEQE